MPCPQAPEQYGDTPASNLPSLVIPMGSVDPTLQESRWVHGSLWVITVGVIGPGVPELVSPQGLERGPTSQPCSSQTRLGKPLNRARGLAGPESALRLRKVEKVVVKKQLVTGLSGGAGLVTTKIPKSPGRWPPPAFEE